MRRSSHCIHTACTQEIRSYFRFLSEKCTVVCIFASEIHLPIDFSSHFFRSIVFLFLSLSLSLYLDLVLWFMLSLSMQTKIKWNNLVFLMLICYLAADGLIHHANMSALAYIHKFTIYYSAILCASLSLSRSRFFTNSHVVWYRLLARAVQPISAHVIKWFMHSFNAELLLRAEATV